MAFRHWLTPRFPLEMLLASAVTLGLVLAFLIPANEAVREPPKAAAPASLQVAMLGPDPRDRMSRFMEQTALAHVGTLRSEAEIEAADAMPTPAAVEIANRDASSRAKALAKTDSAPQRPEFALPKSLALKPPLPIPAARPQDVAINLPEAPRLDMRPKEIREKSSSGFHIPLVGDLTSKLPSGRDVVDGVGSVGKRIGAIFR